MAGVVRVVCGLLCVAAFAVASVDLPAWAQGGRAAELRRAPLTSASSAAQYFTVPLDHEAPNKGTFKVKYYTDTSHTKPLKHGPCFFNMGGEGPLGGIRSDYVSYLAEQYGALVVAIEHRFYGESLPAGGLSLDNLQFLSSRQALADAAALIDALNKEYKHCSGHWFSFGGSYSGALSAWFRIKYPTHTLGSLSSSGVVNALYSFPEFDEQIAEAIGAECANNLRETTKAFEAAEESNPAMARKLLGSPANMSTPDFFYMLADSAAMADQYGHKADLCKALSEVGPTVYARVVGFANFTNTFWGKDFGSNCFYDTNCLINDPKKWQPTSRSWRWQKCSEVAYLQNAPAKGSLRSQFVDLKAQEEQCQQVFGRLPDTNATNNYYGGATPNSTNIFFSDFSDDPWQQASVKKTLSPELPFSLVHCDGCGHCMDLGRPSDADPKPLQDSRAAFETHLKAWLA